MHLMRVAERTIFVQSKFVCIIITFCYLSPSCNSMASLPSPPFIPIDGIHNFRCIGKYPTSNPTSITRSDLLFRSAEPSHVTPSGIEALKALKITTIFDLRSLPEIKRMKAHTPIVEIGGIERVFVPVFKDRDYSPEAIALRYKDYTSINGTNGFRRAYEDILENGSGSYRRIFEHIRDKPKEGCLVHCTAGKDRTGLLVALVLQLAGVADEIIAEEYSLTEVGLAGWKEAIIEHLLWEVGLGDAGREGAERMLGARSV